MRDGRTRAAAAAAFLAALLAPASFAEDAPRKPSPVGVWEFETGAIGSCKISGRMTVDRAAVAGTHKCRFQSVQTCPGTPKIAYTVAQSCTAKVTGTASTTVAITSKVERIVKVEPAEFLQRVTTSYAPDHFTVVINPGATEMKGRFYSHGESTVRFWRPKELTS